MPTFLPEILAERITGEDRVELDLHVPAAIEHFAGHFPGYPILPGVVQVDWAVRLARPRLPVRGAFSALEQLKFQALVLPDARLTLSLAWNPAGRRLEFAYAAADRKYSSGRLVFGSEP